MLYTIAVVGRWLCSDKSPVRGELTGGAGACVFKELTIHHNLVKGTPEAMSFKVVCKARVSSETFLGDIKEAGCRAHIYLAQGCALEQRSECWLQQEVEPSSTNLGGQRIFYF